MEHDFSHLPFRPADILLPQNCDLSLWSVVACDQYTSQPEYWQRVEERVGRAPSALRLILPESSLDGPHVETDIMDVNNTMTHYLREDRFALLPHAMVYVERTLDNGRVRSMTTSPAPPPPSGPRKEWYCPASHPGLQCGRTPPSSCPMSCCCATIPAAPSSSPWLGRGSRWSRCMTST